MDRTSFLAHAIQLEDEAERIYRRSAEVIDPAVNPEAAAFFREMAGYANHHLAEIMELAGIKDIAGVAPASPYGEGGAPEALSPAPVSGDVIDLDSAMAMALAAERRAATFYEAIAAAAKDSQVAELAARFAEEEGGHVLALERFQGLKPY